MSFDAHTPGGRSVSYDGVYEGPGKVTEDAKAMAVNREAMLAPLPAVQGADAAYPPARPFSSCFRDPGGAGARHDEAGDASFGSLSLRPRVRSRRL